MNSNILIGEKIKSLRIKMSLTQEELANRCELSKGFISQLERDLTSPSIATLIDILECLGTDLKEFFSNEIDEKIVFGYDDFFSQENLELGHNIDWIIPNAQKNSMEPIILKLLPNGSSPIYNPSECEIFGYVISGHIVLTIGEKSYKVKKGESFYHKANNSYFIKNNGKNEAKLIYVSTPPSF